jgi:hypothetical protein
VGQEEITDLKAELKEMKQAQGLIYDRLTEIETLLKERCYGRGKEVEKLKDKVGSLERSRAYLIGVATLAGVVITYILRKVGFK